MTTSTINMRFGTNWGLNKIITLQQESVSPGSAKKRRSGPETGYIALKNYGSAGAASWANRSGLLSKANTEHKWTPAGLKKTTNPVQGSGDGEKESKDYTLSYFIGTFVIGAIGLIAIEIGISRRGVKVRATAK